jgi:hypothetical protein
MKIKTVFLSLIMCVFLFASPETNNLIFSQSYKLYSGQTSIGNESAYASRTVALNSEYDYHIANGWKILAGAGVDLGKTYAVLAEVGVKKYLNDNTYLGGAYVIPLGVGEEVLQSSGSWSHREKYTIIGYEPTLALFAGAEFGDDWTAEVRFQRTTYAVRYTVSEGSFRHTNNTEMDSANELSFSLGLIF